jgi:hypothetical protein
MEDIDIWRAAKLLIERHGAEAHLQANLRIDELNEDADQEGAAIWRNSPSHPRSPGAPSCRTEDQLRQETNETSALIEEIRERGYLLGWSWRHR